MNKEIEIYSESSLKNAGVTTHGIYIDPEPLVKKPPLEKPNDLPLVTSGRILMNE